MSRWRGPLEAKALILEMLGHADKAMRQHGEKLMIQECDGQEKDKDEVPPMFYDTKSSRGARMRDNSRGGCN